jgi:hypothetical protein
MAKEVPEFLRAEIGNDATDPTQESQNCMLGRLAQMRLEFAEGRINRSIRCRPHDSPSASMSFHTRLAP